MGSSTSSASSLPLALFQTGRTVCSLVSDAVLSACAAAPVMLPKASNSARGNCRRRGDMAASDRLLTGEFRWEDDPNLPGLCLFNNPEFARPALLQPLGGGLGSGELLEDPGDLVGVEQVLLTA